MTTEKDFSSKEHLTKHLTLGRFGVLEEATRVNSWAEQDFLEWKLYLARTLTPSRVTPQILKTITESAKYRKAYGSYSFGVVGVVKSKWLFIVIAAAIGIVVVLYMMGFLGAR